MPASKSQIIVIAGVCVAVAGGIALLTVKNAKPKSPADRQDEMRGRVQSGMSKLRKAG